MKSPVIAYYSDNPQSESDAESIAEFVALAKVRNYTAAMDWRQLLTTFTGDSPMRPSQLHRRIAMDEQIYIITLDDVSATDADRYAEELRQALLDASPDVKVDLRLMILACKGNRSPMKARQCHPYTLAFPLPSTLGNSTIA